MITCCYIRACVADCNFVQKSRIATFMVVIDADWSFVLLPRIHTFRVKRRKFDSMPYIALAIACMIWIAAATIHVPDEHPEIYSLEGEPEPETPPEGLGNAGNTADRQPQINAAQLSADNVEQKAEREGCLEQAACVEAK